jgi:hypothetical protein
MWQAVFHKKNIDWENKYIVFDKDFKSPSLEYIIKEQKGIIVKKPPTDKKYILITNKRKQAIRENINATYVWDMKYICSRTPEDIIQKVTVLEKKLNPKYPKDVDVYLIPYDYDQFPFLVAIKKNSHTFDVWAHADDQKLRVFSHVVYEKKILQNQKYEKVWVGKDYLSYDQKHKKKIVDTNDKSALGNSILFQTGSGDLYKYIYIWGNNIREFTLNSPVKTFRSAITDIPLAVGIAMTKTEIIFLPSNAIIPIASSMKQRQIQKDPYTLYGENVYIPIQQIIEQENKSVFTKLPVRWILQKGRLWGTLSR